MAQQRSIEIRVGIFVLVSLAVIAGLIIKYGKLEKFSSKTYDISVVFPNVGGIVKEANVMYAGIPIGKVRDITLAEEGQLKVRLTLAIYANYRIRQDARFVINQSGLLGDRYVDIIPQSATAPVVEPGAQLEGATSVDLSEAIRSVVDVLHQAAGTIARVDGAIKRVDEMMLTTQNLAHVSETLANVEAATSNTVALTLSLQSVVDESRVSVTNTFGKFSLAADNFNTASKRVEQVVEDNQGDVRAAAKNLVESTERLNAILVRLEKGEGTVGKLLVDPTLHDELVQLVQNWRRYGIMYKEPAPRRAEPARAGPKSPTNFNPARPAEKP